MHEVVVLYCCIGGVRSLLLSINSSLAVEADRGTDQSASNVCLFVCKFPFFCFLCERLERCIIASCMHARTRARMHACVSDFLLLLLSFAYP